MAQNTRTMILSRLKPILLILACSVAVTECDSSVEPWQLEDTNWQLTELDGESVSSANLETVPNLTFHSAEHRLSGSGGCNILSGSFEVKGSRITLGQLAITERACFEGMEIEQSFFAALENIKTWHVDDDTLELYDSDGKLVMQFESSQPDV